MKWLENITNEEASCLGTDFVINRPKATDTYTVKQLEKLGAVGVYERNPNAGSMVLAVFAVVVLIMICVGVAALLIRSWVG